MELQDIALPVMPVDGVLIDCDLDAGNRAALLWIDKGGPMVLRDGVQVALPSIGHGIRNLRWIGEDLLVWPVNGYTALLTDGNITTMLPCAPREILVSDRFIYACYGEEQFLTGVDDGDHAGDRVTVFDQTGTRLFGVNALMGELRDDPELNEFTQGAISPDGRLIFIADASPRLWTLDPTHRELTSIALDRPIEVADSVAGVLLKDRGVGLMTCRSDSIEIVWFDRLSGALMREDREAVSEPSSGSSKFRTRSVSAGTAIFWRGRHLLRIR